MTPLLIPLIILIGLIFLQMLWAISRYIKCPPDKILVIYGKVSADPNEKYKIITSGAAFVWPVIQEYTFVHSAPKESSLAFKTYSKEGKKILIDLKIIHQISKDQNEIEKAVELFFKKEELIIEEIITTKIQNKIEELIPIYSVEELSTKEREIITQIKTMIPQELSKMGLEMVGVKRITLS